MSGKQTWFITGAGRGMGVDIARAALDAGHAVVATGRNTEAVREAQDYTWHALKKAYRPGMGQFLPDRLFWAREDDASPAGADEGERVSDAERRH